MHRAIPMLSSAFQAALGEILIGIYDKSAKTLAKNGGEASEDGWVLGAAPEGHFATEHGHRFDIDWERGQKTGFFIDQRENRALLGSLASGKKVLNVFSYTGGFSIYALKSGATEVHSLDSSQRALDVCESNVKLNDLNPEQHRSIQADALEFLKTDALGDYDIVVLDPPAFAKRASARHAAVQGYKRINLRAMEGMKAGSLLFHVLMQSSRGRCVVYEHHCGRSHPGRSNCSHSASAASTCRPPRECLSPRGIVSERPRRED